MRLHSQTHDDNSPAAQDVFLRVLTFGETVDPDVDGEGLRIVDVDPGNRPGDAERRLMLDVLRSAITDSLLVGPRTADIRDGARAWLRGDPGLFTIDDCCDELGISYNLLSIKLSKLWARDPGLSPGPRSKRRYLHTVLPMKRIGA